MENVREICNLEEGGRDDLPDTVLAALRWFAYIREVDLSNKILSLYQTPIFKEKYDV